MSISFLHFAGSDFTTGRATFAQTITATTAGSILIVAGQMDPVSSGVTIDNGHADAVTTVSAAQTDGAPISGTSWIFAFFAPTTGTTTITATYSGTNPTYGDIGVWEIAGISGAGTDVHINATGVGTAVDSGASGVLTSPNEAIIGYGLTSTNFSAGGGAYTKDLITTSTGSLYESKVVAANTTTSADGTLASSGTWRMYLASFYAASADVLLGQACL